MISASQLVSTTSSQQGSLNDIFMVSRHKIEQNPEEHHFEDIIDLVDWLVSILQIIDHLTKRRKYDPFLMIRFGSKKEMFNTYNNDELINITHHIKTIFQVKQYKQYKKRQQGAMRFIDLQKTLRTNLHSQSHNFLKEIKQCIVKSIFTPFKKNEEENFLKVQDLFLNFAKIEHIHQVMTFIKQARENPLFSQFFRDILVPLEQWDNLSQDKILEKCDFYLSKINNCLLDIQESKYSQTRSRIDSSFLLWTPDQTEEKINHLLRFEKQQLQQSREKVKGRYWKKRIYSKIGTNKNSWTLEDWIANQKLLLGYRIEVQTIQIIAKKKLESIFQPVISTSQNQFTYEVPWGEEINLNQLTRKQDVYCFIYCLICSCKQLEEMGLYNADFKREHILRFSDGMRLIDFDHVYNLVSENANLRKLIRILLIQSSSTNNEDPLIDILFKLQNFQFLSIQKKFKSEFGSISNKQQLQLLAKTYEDKCLNLMKKGWKASHIRQLQAIIQQLLANWKVKELIGPTEEQIIEKACAGLAKVDPENSSYGYCHFLEEIFQSNQSIEISIFSGSQTSLNSLGSFSISNISTRESESISELSLVKRSINRLEKQIERSGIDLKEKESQYLIEIAGRVSEMADLRKPQ